MKDIRAITIDLDDTLWENQSVIRSAERVLREWLGLHYPQTTEMFSADAMRDMRKAVAHEFAEFRHDLTFLRRTALARIGIAAGYGDGLVDAAMQVFDDARNTVDLYPEVRPALRALREKHVLIAVTNGNASLERIGIADLFDGFVSARTAGAAKPERQIFDTAVNAGGATPQQTLHVGDHPEYDIGGARAAGLKTAWVNRHGGDWPEALPEPDVVVRHVGQLQARLAASSR